jgi:hypothetical protein
MQVGKYTTNKGKDGIIADGYKYRLDKAFKNTNLWRCFVWSLCYIIYRFALTGLS